MFQIAQNSLYQVDLSASKSDVESLDFMQAALGVLSISGKDAQSFLQGQLTCDLEKLDTSKATVGCYCNSKGRIIANFYLRKQADQTYQLITAHSAVTNLKTILMKHAIFSKVTIQETPAIIYGIAGDIGLLIETDITVAHLYCCYEITGGIIITIANSPNLALFISTTQQTLAIPPETTIHPCQINDWLQLQIQQQLVMINQHTSEKHTPHDINLAARGYVAFDKGCYLGQEIIARMEYLGKTKKQLFSCIFKGTKTPYPQQPIFVSNLKIGTIVMVASLNIHEYLVLASLRLDAIKPNQKHLHCDDGWDVEILHQS